MRSVLLYHELKYTSYDLTVIISVFSLDYYPKKLVYLQRTKMNKLSTHPVTTVSFSFDFSL